MGNTFKIIICYLFIFLPFFSSAEHNVQFLILASEPIAYIENDKKKGIYVDILTELSRKLDRQTTSTINVIPYPRLMKMLENNKDGFIVTILFPNPNIASKVLQSISVMTFKNAIISKKNHALDKSNLTGSVIANLRGTEFSFGDKFTQLVDSKKITLVPINRVSQGIDMLMFGRVDGYFGPVRLHKYWLDKTNNDWDKTIATPILFDETTAKLMISVAPNISAEDLNIFLKKLEGNIKVMQKNQFIEKTIEYYIGK